MSVWPSIRGRWKQGWKDSTWGSSQQPQEDYEALRDRCLRDRCLFEDSSFPATQSSIGRGPLLQKLPPHLQWRRPPVRTAGPRNSHKMWQCPGLGASGEQV
ncbi:Hypothetical predicted protein [Marmota monax]|uniref:Uncharacterized protein n=1 Tax=Marmota monax TaxID=9995 RepID=A0A5E4BUT3_MARMO|nr:Hypothetical predicted protein [Marmota monax]